MTTATAQQTAAETEPKDQTLDGPEDAQADAEFAAGFEETDTPPAPTEETPPAEGTPAATPDTTPAPAPRLAQITEEQYQHLLNGVTRIDQISATLEKVSGTAFGKIGGLERMLRELTADTPAGEQVAISEEDFEELKGDFPDVAKYTAAGLNRVLSKMKLKGTAAPAFDEGKVSSIVAAEVKKAREEQAIETMDLIEPAWRETVKSKGYTDWLTAQPEAYRLQIANSWNLAEVRESITKYRQFAAEQAKPPTPPKPGGGRRNRFAAATPPPSVGGTPPGRSDDDEFLAGFEGR